MTTQEKLAYIRNTYGYMLNKINANAIYSSYIRSMSLVEAWSLDSSISLSMQKELESEINAVYYVALSKTEV